LDPDSFLEALERRGEMRRGTTRLLFSRAPDGGLLLFAGGETHRLAAERLGLADLLTGRRTLTWLELRPWVEDPACRDLLCTLYNQGHYELPD
jgi:50S ribosomal protein L16 3-hydroxylase